MKKIPKFLKKSKRLNCQTTFSDACTAVDLLNKQFIENNQKMLDKTTIKRYN